MRRLLMLAIAASLLIPFSSVAAAPQTPDRTPSVAPSIQSACVSPHFYNEWTGNENSTPTQSQSRSGASATIDVDSSHFDICTNSNTDYEGPSAWVAITPRVTDPSQYDPTKIMQVGIIECRGVFLFDNPCFGENTPHFFWAYGGCAPFTPKPQDMGVANYGPHTYAVYLDASGWWHFQIDGAAQGTAKHKILNNSQMDCWTGSLRKAVWSFERWDAGDSYGAVSQLSYFTNARYGVYNQGWFDPLWINGACFAADGDSVCDKYSSDNFRVRDN